MNQNLHLDDFCQFWFDNFNTPIPPLPQQPSDLTVTQLEQLRMYDGGKLYQNLFRVTDPKKLPADLARNISKGLVDFKHKDLYRQHGWEFQAQQIEKSEVEAQNILLEKEIEASKERQKIAEQKREQWNNMSLLERMAAEPLSQDQILQNRKRYGMS
tara:strand:+ start:204 stop:674 length:471 start_codon:yes stop_codon:yes gene_type:complete